MYSFVTAKRLAEEELVKIRRASHAPGWYQRKKESYGHIWTFHMPNSSHFLIKDPKHEDETASDWIVVD